MLEHTNSSTRFDLHIDEIKKDLIFINYKDVSLSVLKFKQLFHILIGNIHPVDKTDNHFCSPENFPFPSIKINFRN